jgi:hypothetical protein
MARFVSHPAIRTTLGISCALLLPYAHSMALARSFTQFTPQGTPQSPPAQLLGPDQLDSLVAPIALYPDPPLGQVLAACTYPIARLWEDGDGLLTGSPTVFLLTVSFSTLFLGLAISTAGLTRAAVTMCLRFGLTIRLTGWVFPISMGFWRPAIRE